MPFPRPSLPDLITQVTQQLAVNLQGLDPTLARQVITVVGMTLAQGLNLEYGYLSNFPAQFFVRTATGGYLDDRGNPYEVYRQQGAGSAGQVSVTGLPSSPLPAGSVAQTLDQSQSFITAAAITLDPVTGLGTATVNAQNVGAAGNLAAGTTLTLVSGAPGVNAQVSVAAPGFTGGVDIESDAAYRVRVQARMGQPPQGGDADDYVAWVKTVPGVTRAWTYRWLYGLGSVAVAAVYDGRSPASIIPNSGDLAAQLAVLENDAPTVGTVSTFALAPDPVAVTLSSLTPLGGYTQATALANATTSLAALFAATTPGGATAGDGIVAGNTPGQVFLADIYDAIKQSAGVSTFDLSAPTADYTAATGHIPALGAVTLTT